MRVLLHAYNTCCQNLAGGVQNRIRKICALLVQRNIRAELFNPYQHKIDDFDILHIFMLKGETLSLMRLAKNRGLKIVLSSIINTKGGWKIDLYNKILGKLPIATTYKTEYEAIHLADAIIVETPNEARFIQNHYNVHSSKCLVIPNGVDKPLFHNGKEIFEVVSSPKFVLQVGRFDENKNQLNVIKALRGTNVEVVFIGGADQISSEYYQKCLQESNGCNNIHFLGWLENTNPLFMSALKWADALILPSYHETFGLVLLEAGINGTKLLISKTLPILEYESLKDSYKFNPSDVKNIREVVLNSMNSGSNPQLKNNIEKEFSWDTVIKQHINLYSDLLE